MSDAERVGVDGALNVAHDHPDCEGVPHVEVTLRALTVRCVEVERHDVRRTVVTRTKLSTKCWHGDERGSHEEQNQKTAIHQ